jgi:hypothetical protein
MVIGAEQGRKASALRACDEPFDDEEGEMAGFSLQAGVAAGADKRK